MIREETTAFETGGLHHISSIHEDVWHELKEPGAYEWWYFDAVSDDERETLVVIFLDGFIFSPRYNRAVKKHLRESQRNNINNHAPQPCNFPAIAISLYRDECLAWRAINEYEPNEFAARKDCPECHIGSNNFKLETDAGERVYRLQLDSPLRGGRRLQASLAWSVQEGDFSSCEETGGCNSGSAHVWNLVAPKCRVTGTISVIGSNGVQREERQWTGTGYHDHNLDTRWMPATINEWQWGRAHFDDATVVFYRYSEQGRANITTRLYLVRNNEVKIYEPQFAASEWHRHFFGLRYPRTLQLDFGAGDAMHSVQIRQQRIVDGSFFYLRFTGEAQLDLGDGKMRRAVIVAEQLAPRALQWRALWWLTGMRIGRHERHSFLP